MDLQLTYYYCSGKGVLCRKHLSGSRQNHVDQLIQIFYFLFSAASLLAALVAVTCIPLTVLFGKKAHAYIPLSGFSVPADFPFAIDKHTGELFARGFIDRETKENYNFEVTVSISLSPRSCDYTLVISVLATLVSPSSLTSSSQATDLGEPVQNTSCEVHIKIKDVNDVRPRFYTDPYLAHVPENLDPGHKVRPHSPFQTALIPLSRPS